MADCTCKTGTPNQGTLEQVGQPKHNKYMGGKASEILTDYRCTVCGATWQHVNEWGLSRGRFWNRLNKP